jgi:ubiquinone/menaquinone biosynthesis C-methylase UbiE
MIVGVDISEVAVKRAADAYRARAGSALIVMDGHALAFASSAFDIVSFTESIEHMHDVERVIAEIHRVLKPGGRLLVTTPNANSLHLVMTRKLGYPAFKTSNQHVREYTFDEVRDLLQKAGFVISRSAGMFLYPYWGIPGIDQIARPITDSDPELVELMRELGRRVGPEHSYLMVILAEKAPG